MLISTVTTQSSVSFGGDLVKISGVGSTVASINTLISIFFTIILHFQIGNSFSDIKLFAIQLLHVAFQSLHGPLDVNHQVNIMQIKMKHPKTLLQLAIEAFTFCRIL